MHFYFFTQNLRKDLLVMRDYFIQCRLARDAQLLQQLNQLLHFKDNAHSYSLPDLAALQDGSLLPRLQNAHREYTDHIKECPVSHICLTMYIVTLQPYQVLSRKSK